jgi:hypothetical protein
LIVEYTVIFPLFILAILGTVDISYMFFEWGMADKAAYAGARTAVVTYPVAQNITNPSYTATQLQNIGVLCFANDTGVANGNCPTFSTVCTPASSRGSCTNGYAWGATEEAAFTRILAGMQAVFPRLGRQNVLISYQSNGLGFVGRPGGLPMDVTVSISCMTHQFFFINGLMGWAFPAPAGCPAGTPGGPLIPTYATTLTSESMATN